MRSKILAFFAVSIFLIPLAHAVSIYVPTNALSSKISDKRFCYATSEIRTTRNHDKKVINQSEAAEVICDGFKVFESSTALVFGSEYTISKIGSVMVSEGFRVISCETKETEAKSVRECTFSK